MVHLIDETDKCLISFNYLLLLEMHPKLRHISCNTNLKLVDPFPYSRVSPALPPLSGYHCFNIGVSIVTVLRLLLLLPVAIGDLTVVTSYTGVSGNSGNSGNSGVSGSVSQPCLSRVAQLAVL